MKSEEKAHVSKILNKSVDEGIWYAEEAPWLKYVNNQVLIKVWIPLFLFVICIYTLWCENT